MHAQVDIVPSRSHFSHAVGETCWASVAPAHPAPSLAPTQARRILSHFHNQARSLRLKCSRQLEPSTVPTSSCAAEQLYRQDHLDRLEDHITDVEDLTVYHRESFAPFRFVAHNGFCVFARSSSPRTFGRTTAKYTNALSRDSTNPSGSTSRSTSCGRSIASCPHSAARNFGFWLCRRRAILRSGTSSSRLCGREKPDRKAVAMTEVLREPFRVPRILTHLTLLFSSVRHIRRSTILYDH